MTVINKKPIVIAGPCSAESEEQLYSLVASLENSRVDIIRAGIWKPRTRPGAFEGVGEVGLKWISELKKSSKAIFAVEVATPQHVELALKAEIDVLWIGARSTANPFVVQAIADALRGVDIPIMVKNPINPDLSLWIGAIERLNMAGAKEIMAIHRGFSTIHSSKYRNLPLWRIPIELKSKLPKIPIICDPSHICGNRSLIFDIAQKAMDLDYNGLMLEVHPDPDNALSDSKQQLTPYDFIKLIDNLQFSHSKNQGPYSLKQLKDMKNDIYQLDTNVAMIIDEIEFFVGKAELLKLKNNLLTSKLSSI